MTTPAESARSRGLSRVLFTGQLIQGLMDAFAFAYRPDAPGIESFNSGGNPARAEVVVALNDGSVFEMIVQELTEEES